MKNFDWNKISTLITTKDLGVDLGTSNVVIYAENKGLVLRAPSVVALDKNTGKIIQTGAGARNMMGRTPGNVVAMHPLKDGVISDHEMTVAMLKDMFSKSSESNFLAPKPRTVISVPSGITEVEERNVINAAIDAGARRVYLIEEPLAAALGAGLNLSGPKGHMVVDIGGGTTDIAVLTMNDVAVSSSLKIAGNYFDEQIVRYVRRVHGVAIGQPTAENAKIRLARAVPGTERQTMVVKGRDVNTGVPQEVELSSEEITEILARPLQQIADEILYVLERTSPELVGDIAEQGIVLTGGSAEMWGIEQFIADHTRIPCTVADDPASCTAIGCGRSIAWIKTMSEGPINIARKRAMKS
ncbi:MAG: rod shape-determining protein [Oscillospiraceae bacterium]|nr:rod shape-determining protein [Oscillospiraceae bacterium]